MFAANLVKYLSRRASASVGYVIKPLTDAFLCISAGGDVEPDRLAEVIRAVRKA